LTNFRFCFPFGRPEGALKASISLLERVKPSKFNVEKYLKEFFSGRF